MSYLPYGSSGVSSWLVATGSSLLAHGAVIAFAYGGIAQFLVQTPAPRPETDYVITLERLDADTLAGLLEQQAASTRADPQAADGGTDDPQDITGDTDAPEQLAALRPADPPQDEEVAPPPEEIAEEPPATDPPEEVTETDVETPPDLAVETPQVIVPDSLAAQTATPLEQIAPDMATTLDLAVIAPTTALPAEIPERIDSSPLIAQTVVPVGPSTSQAEPVVPLAPLASDSAQTALVASAPTLTTTTQTAPNTLTPLRDTGAEPVSALNTRAALATPPNPTPPAAAAPPSAQDLAIADLIARIRATPADPCLLALPRRDGAEGVGLELIAATDGAMAQFADALLTPADADLRQTRTLVDPRQCAALAYLRNNRDYPATRLGIALDAADVTSGAELTGILRGVAGRYVLLLIIDNNGVVQDLQRFLSFSGNFARFSVPVTRVGAPRDTSQMLVAITTDRPAATIRARDGQLAEDVFADLDADQGRNAAIGLAVFDVR